MSKQNFNWKLYLRGLVFKTYKLSKLSLEVKCSWFSLGVEGWINAESPHHHGNMPKIMGLIFHQQIAIQPSLQYESCGLHFIDDTIELLILLFIPHLTFTSIRLSSLPSIYFPTHQSPARVLYNLSYWKRNAVNRNAAYCTFPKPIF